MIKIEDILPRNLNYYDITDGWNDAILSVDAEQCKTLCIENISCVYAIHFYKNQYIPGNSNTNYRLPLNAKMNTCILRGEFKIQFGTNKDSSSNIYYLIGSRCFITYFYKINFKFKTKI